MSAGSLLVLELLDEFRLGLVRRMNGEVVQAQKKWLILVSPDEIERLVGEKIGEVGPLWVVDRRLRDEVEVLAHGRDSLVEAALGGMVFPRLTKVPLAEQRCCVPGLLECLRHRDLFEGHLLDVVHRAERAALPVEAVDASDGIDTRARSVLSADESGARRLAVRPASVAGCETQALSGELVDVGRLVVLRALAAEVGPAEVVGENEDDVRLWCGMRRAGRE